MSIWCVQERPAERTYLQERVEYVDTSTDGTGAALASVYSSRAN